jgi:hypothetical protein
MHQRFTTQGLMDRLPESHITGELSQYCLDPKLDAFPSRLGKVKIRPCMSRSFPISRPFQKI